jgi:hypothetical protein
MPPTLFSYYAKTIFSASQPTMVKSPSLTNGQSPETGSPGVLWWIGSLFMFMICWLKKQSFPWPTLLHDRRVTAHFSLSH